MYVHGLMDLSISCSKNLGVHLEDTVKSNIELLIRALNQNQLTGYTVKYNIDICKIVVSGKPLEINVVIPVTD